MTLLAGLLVVVQTLGVPVGILGDSHDHPDAVTTAAATADAGRVTVSDPVRVRAGAVEIDAPLDPLGVGPDGAIEVPDDVDRAGWRVGGPEPGEPGAAVILAHVDSKTGPAAFYRLGDLASGDRIEVDGADGAVTVWEVDRVERHPKDDFPTAAVYGPTAGPTLRLVTCGGVFDRGTGHYRDNVIVYADPAAPSTTRARDERTSPPTRETAGAPASSPSTRDTGGSTWR